MVAFVAIRGRLHAIEEQLEIAESHCSFIAGLGNVVDDTAARRRRAFRDCVPLREPV